MTIIRRVGQKLTWSPRSWKGWLGLMLMIAAIILGGRYLAAAFGWP